MEQEQVKKLLQEIAKQQEIIAQAQRQIGILEGTYEYYEKQKRQQEKRKSQQQRQYQREQKRIDKALISGDKAEKYAQKLIRMMKELRQCNYPGAPGMADSIRQELLILILHGLDNAALGYQAISRISSIDNNEYKVDNIIRETLRKKW